MHRSRKFIEKVGGEGGVVQGIIVQIPNHLLETSTCFIYVFDLGHHHDSFKTLANINFYMVSGLLYYCMVKLNIHKKLLSNIFFLPPDTKMSNAWRNDKQWAEGSLYFFNTYTILKKITQTYNQHITM